MVATAGSMRIIGSLDTGNIKTGFNTVKMGFNHIKGVAKSFQSDLVRMSNATSVLAKRFAALSLAGLGAMVALAKSAPAVAPAMAKMKIEVFKLKMALGEALAPAFEKVAVWMGKLSSWVAGNKDKITDISMRFLGWAETLGVKLWPVLKKIGGWVVEHPGIFAGLVAGLALGPSIIKGIGLITGLVSMLSTAVINPAVLAVLGIAGVGVAGAMGGQALAEKAGFAQGTSGWDVAGRVGAGALGGAATGALVGSVVPGIGTATGALVGGAAGALYGGGKEAYKYFTQSESEINRKQFLMQQEDAVWS